MKKRNPKRLTKASGYKQSGMFSDVAEVLTLKSQAGKDARFKPADVQPKLLEAARKRSWLDYKKNPRERLTKRVTAKRRAKK